MFVSVCMCWVSACILNPQCLFTHFQPGSPILCQGCIRMCYTQQGVYHVPCRYLQVCYWRYSHSHNSDIGVLVKMHEPHLQTVQGVEFQYCTNVLIIILTAIAANLLSAACAEKTPFILIRLSTKEQIWHQVLVDYAIIYCSRSILLFPRNKPITLFKLPIILALFPCSFAFHRCRMGHRMGHRIAILTYACIEPVTWTLIENHAITCSKIINHN